MQGKQYFHLDFVYHTHSKFWTINIPRNSIDPDQSGFALFADGLYNTLFNYQKADDKIFFNKFSKVVKPKPYYIENSKTREQTV